MIRNIIAAALTTVALTSSTKADEDGPNLFGMDNACQNVMPDEYPNVLSPDVTVGVNVEENTVMMLRCANDHRYELSCPQLAALVAFRNAAMPALIRDGAPVAQVIDYFNNAEDALATYCISTHKPGQSPT